MNCQMVFAIATRRWPRWWECVESWLDNASDSYIFHIVYDKNVLEAYQECLEFNSEPIIAFIHDDTVIHEKGWDRRVLDCFDDPNVGLVGFGGGLRHGRPDLYVAPYELAQLGRFGFRSNMRNAEDHGERFAGECDVAVLDGFAMFVRRSILEKAGGWPLGTPIGYLCYDYWLSCIVREQGYKIRLVGVDCEHLGGKTATISNLQLDFEGSHKYIYERFKNILPYEVP